MSIPEKKRGPETRQARKAMKLSRTVRVPSKSKAATLGAAPGRAPSPFAVRPGVEPLDLLREVPIYQSVRINGPGQRSLGTSWP